MKKVLFLLAAVVAVYSMNDISKPYTFSPSELIRSSRINTNYDTAYNAINRNKDSIEVNFIRFKDLTGHDSTLKYLAVDTIRSNPNIDSIAGNTVFSGAPVIKSALTVDSINSTKNITAPGVKLTGLTSSYIPYQNSSGFLANGPIYTNGTNIALGKTTLENWGSSHNAIQVGGAGALWNHYLETSSALYLSNNIYFDNTNVRAIYGTGTASATAYCQTQNGKHIFYSATGLTDNGIVTLKDIVQWDSLGNVTALGRITGTDIAVTDSVKGVTGTFTGVVKVDSINSTKGITTAGRLVGTDLEVTDSVKAATGTFTGIVKVDSLNITKGIVAALGTFAGIVKADSVNSTKGIATSARVTATDFEASDSVKAVTGTFTGSISTDSIKFGAGNKITYLDTTFYDSLFDGTTYRTRSLVRLIQIGSLITLYQNVMSGTITMSTNTTIRGLPDKFKPAVSTSPVINIYENGTDWVIGTARILKDFNYVGIQKGGTFLAPGVGGIEQCVLQWMIN